MDIRLKRVTLCAAAVLAAGMAVPSRVPQARAAVHAAPVAAPVRSHTAFLDVPRFLGDMGLGYYAYHHYVLKRYNAGSFKPDAANRLFSLGKAGTALSFAYDRFNGAYRRTTNTGNQRLHALAPSLNALLRATNTESNKLKKGEYSDADLRNYNKMIDDFRQKARGIGDIVDIRISIPGA